MDSSIEILGSFPSDYNLTIKDEETESRFHKLNALHQLQKCMVRQSMHNAMSPISAISGYLELMNMSISDGEADIDRIERYREKIMHGISEVNRILEQLHELYKEEGDEVDEPAIDFDINWVIRQQCAQLKAFTQAKVHVNNSLPAIHVCSDLYATRLIISNLLNYLLKCTKDGNRLHLAVERDDSSAVVSFTFKSICQRKEIMRDIISGDNYDSLENSYDKGLKNSVKLLEQIEGHIEMNEDGNEILLQLYLPLAD